VPERWRRVSWLSVVSIGCAVGLLMAAAAIADSILRQPFLDRSADPVVAVFARHVATARERELTSFVIFQDWQARATSFEHLSGYRLSTTNVLGEPMPQTVRAAQVTPGFFESLQITPARGRAFVSEELTPEGSRICVISDGLWKSRYGGNASILGSTIRLDNVGGMGLSGPYTIVGIAPATLRYPERVDIWMPFSAPEFFLKSRAGQWFGVVGRMHPGISLEQATTEMDAVMRAQQTEHPGQQPTHTANLVPIRHVLTARYEALIGGLAAASALLLVVVAASAGGLLAARALREQQYDRIRLSLGARTGTLVSAAAREGAALGVLAFAISVPASLVCLRVLGTVSVESFDLPLPTGISVLSVFAGLACAVGVSTALAVLVKMHALRQTDRIGTFPNQARLGSSRATTRLRGGLIVTEVALSVVLLAAAADLLARVAALRDVDLGFETDRLLTVRVALPTDRYAGTRAPQFYESLIERVRTLPSVANVAASSDDPLFGVSANPEFTLEYENRTLTPDERTPVLVNGVTDTYFDVLGLRLVEGEAPGALSATINQTFARRLFPGVDPIGRRFRFGGRNQPWWTIAGIVADARNDGPAASPKPTAYLPYPAFGKSEMTLLVKTNAEVDAVVPSIRAIIADLDPDLPIGRVAAAADRVEARFASLRIGALVMTLLATAALMLTGLGLYGVLAAVATQIRPEIGLRMALGASPVDMLRLILGRAVTVVAAGLALGAGFAVAAGLTLRTMAPVEIPGPRGIIILIASVCLVSLAAAVRPAWQALRVRPAEALRAE
jgi:putative ABC transport system permease protein